MSCRYSVGRIYALLVMLRLSWPRKALRTAGRAQIDCMSVQPAFASVCSLTNAGASALHERRRADVTAQEFHERGDFGQENVTNSLSEPWTLRE
jgi:hypothetical protein